MWRAWFALFLASLPLSATYSNLIAVGNKTVYFKAPTGLVEEGWFAVTDGRVVQISQPVGDAAGQVTAFSTYGDRYCGFSGSTCFLASICSANLSIKGPRVDTTVSNHRTQVRLDRSGSIAWIDQDRFCFGLGRPTTAPLNGLYDAATLRLIAPANGAKLANLHSGRRLITDRGAVLTFSGLQLQWLDANGSRTIHHVNGAYEAVTDALGENVVYAEDTIGALHWIAGQDENLGLIGSAPALSDDGSKLYYLDADGSIRSYMRSTALVQRLGSGTYSEFSVAGDSLFAVTADGHLMRISTATGEEIKLVDRAPQIRSVDLPAVGLGISCVLVCYGPQIPWFYLGQGMLVVVRGTGFGPGWWVSSPGAADTPLQTIDSATAYFVAPAAPQQGSPARAVEIYHPQHPIRLRVMVFTATNAVRCLGMLHENSSRPVTPDDPAVSMEIISVYATGLNALPVLSDPEAAAILYFGPAPGLTAIQQLNLRIERAWDVSERSLFNGLISFGCEPPDVRP